MAATKTGKPAAIGPLLSVAEAAERWRVSRKTVYEWIALGEFREGEIVYVGPRRVTRIDALAYERRKRRRVGRPAGLRTHLEVMRP